MIVIDVTNKDEVLLLCNDIIPRMRRVYLKHSQHNEHKKITKHNYKMIINKRVFIQLLGSLVSVFV